MCALNNVIYDHSIHTYYGPMTVPIMDGVWKCPPIFYLPSPFLLLELRAL